MLVSPKSTSMNTASSLIAPTISLERPKKKTYEKTSTLSASAMLGQVILNRLFTVSKFSTLGQVLQKNGFSFWTIWKRLLMANILQVVLNSMNLPKGY